MGENFGRPYFGNHIEHKVLRRPHCLSSLSPLAKEFVPNKRGNVNTPSPQQPYNRYSGPQAPPQQASVQSRLQISGSSGGGGGGYHPSSNSAHNTPMPENDSSSTSQTPGIYEPTSEESTALNYALNIVNCLNDNPGSFDTISSRTLNIFEDFKNNHFVLSNAMEIIFNKSIDEQNFCYMGAKLYGLFDSMNPVENSVFRSLLSLKLAYHQDEIKHYMATDTRKVRGTTLFLAELYLQLKKGGSHMKEIAQNIVFSMKQLLQEPIPENIKCICLTFKLAGYELELDCPAEISTVINGLSNLKPPGNPSKVIIETVLKLQKTNWGRNEIPPPTTPTNNSTITKDNTKYSDEPVFYGPDGQVITEEENHFLESNIPSDMQDDDDNDSDIDPEMDDEMQLEYENFLNNIEKSV